MSEFTYYTKEGKFETNEIRTIPWKKLHSDNDIPAFVSFDGYKHWYLEGKLHRENGPAITWSNGTLLFYLYGIEYENVNDWLRNHPNQDKVFQVQMILQYS